MPAGMEQAKVKRKAEEKALALLELAKRARVAAAAPQATGGGPPADDALYQALAKEDSTVCRQASRDARQASVNAAGCARGRKRSSTDGQELDGRPLDELPGEIVQAPTDFPTSLDMWKLRHVLRSYIERMPMEDKVDGEDIVTYLTKTLKTVEHLSDVQDLDVPRVIERLTKIKQGMHEWREIMKSLKCPVDIREPKQALLAKVEDWETASREARRYVTALQQASRGIKLQADYEKTTFR